VGDKFRSHPGLAIDDGSRALDESPRHSSLYSQELVRVWPVGEKWFNRLLDSLYIASQTFRRQMEGLWETDVAGDRSGGYANLEFLFRVADAEAALNGLTEA
jgi:hypothetical protein